MAWQQVQSEHNTLGNRLNLMFLFTGSKFRWIQEWSERASQGTLNEQVPLAEETWSKFLSTNKAPAKPPVRAPPPPPPQQPAGLLPPGRVAPEL